MKSSPDWVSKIDEWYAEGTPFVGLIAFDPDQGWVVPLHEAEAYGLKFTIDEMTGSALHQPPTTWRFDPPSFEGYQESFTRVHEALYRGDSYLTNLCTRAQIYTDLSLDDIYEIVGARYKVLWQDRFVCFSPETFIKIENGVIHTYPMKGTIDASILGAARLLKEDIKEVAEHHTIVDLMRNDLSMIAEDVEVRRLMYLDRLETHSGPILQMSSEITGRLKHDAKLHMGRALYHLLPAGSISGAPKERTLQIIQEAESVARGYYTGIFVHHDGARLISAVMIRYIAQGEEGKLWYHSGGGITALSNCNKEYDEILKKIYLPLY